jgi:hypothetical protein
MRKGKSLGIKVFRVLETFWGIFFEIFWGNFFIGIFFGFFF